jgi:ferric-dicitrate binding protein FerR (iron transport regulator)
MDIKKNIIIFKKKFKVRTVTAVTSVRATKFLVYEDDKMGTELMVLEGSVEMKGIKGGKTIIVNAGYKGTATKDGILSDPQQIDLSTIERWWE